MPKKQVNNPNNKVVKRKGKVGEQTSGRNYTIYYGDCLEVLPSLDEKSVDLVFADPPYNLQLSQELYRPNQTRVDGVDDAWDKFSSFSAYDKFTEEWLRACRRVMKDDATLWVIGSYHNIFRVGKIMMDLGFWILNDIQWYKTNPMPNFRGVRFTNATETLIWAKKSEKQKKYTFNYQTMRHLNGGKQMKSVWHIPLCTGNERIKDKHGRKAHSTQKPEALLMRVIHSSSRQHEMVLDPFAGTGTTCAVANKLGRKTIGIEKEAEYVKIIQNRLQYVEEGDFRDLLIEEPQKTKALKVTVKDLIDAEYIKVSQKLFSSDKKFSAIVQPDGNLKKGNISGSIHQVGRALQNVGSCNGWTFWYSLDDRAGMIMIDVFRQQYRAAKLQEL